MCSDSPHSSDRLGLRSAPTTAAIIQARVGSSRLPGKVLMDISGKPMLARVVERVKAARSLDSVWVATSTAQPDDAIASLCMGLDVPCYRGSEVDVLERFYQAAQAANAETIVRITADCPLIDPLVIDRVVDVFSAGSYDYVSNTVRYTYPDGLDVEVFSYRALEQAWRRAVKPSEREHVTSFMRSHSEFATYNVENGSGQNLSHLRWTVDTEDDLERIRTVYRELGSNGAFGMNDVVNLIARAPDLAGCTTGEVMNAGYYKSIYDQSASGAAAPLTLTRSRELFERASSVIPGCAQTFSKGYNQYVFGVSPIFLERGKGCRVWDVDGNEYIDYVQGLLPNILGYANDDVNQAAFDQYARGHSFSLPHPLELELADRLIEMIPCAEMVRFGKNGSDATSGAVRAARAFTGRDRIACCGYHGWQDWYIGSTTRNAGVPQAVRELTHPFLYNSLDSLKEVLTAHPGEFAAVILEPFNFVEPEPGFLQSVKDLAHEGGALLIYDEICTGFHFGIGGAQSRFGVIPDLACFGKAMGNGYPISCVVGRKEVMQIFAEIFFSFTFAGEVASMAAALKVLDILQSSDALARIAETGRRLQDGFNTFARLSGLDERYKATGFPSWTLLNFKGNGTDAASGMIDRSLFQQECIKRGILTLATHNISAAHDGAAIDRTLDVYGSVFRTLADFLSDPNPERFLEGAPIKPVFNVR